MKRRARRNITMGVAVKKLNGDPEPTIRLCIEHIHYYMSPCEAYELANNLVDAAEKIDNAS